jgi:hypothetical protein
VVCSYVARAAAGAGDLAGEEGRGAARRRRRLGRAAAGLGRPPPRAALLCLRAALLPLHQGASSASAAQSERPPARPPCQPWARRPAGLRGTGVLGTWVVPPPPPAPPITSPCTAAGRWRWRWRWRERGRWRRRCPPRCCSLPLAWAWLPCAVPSTPTTTKALARPWPRRMAMTVGRAPLRAPRAAGLSAPTARRRRRRRGGGAADGCCVGGGWMMAPCMTR